jgi:hypothetical protein
MKAHLVLSFAFAAFTCPLVAQDSTTVPEDTMYVEYHESPITLPLGIGLRIPSYDRVNGLTLPWGPQLVLGDDRLELDALVSYRSHLGNWDPSIEASFRATTADQIKLYVGRGTFTNDAWIRSDLLNSAAALFVGSDARNYYRADRASLRLTHTLGTAAATITPFIAGNTEKDWSTGSLTPDKTPWSFFGRKGDLKMRRPNPPVSKGRVNSILGGSGFQISRGGLEAKLDASVEHAFKAPTFGCAFPVIPGVPGVACGEAGFTQTTLDSRAKFPTFGNQTFEFKGHAVVAGGDVLPSQRFVYLGGAGTLATVDLLALGGDNLLFLMGDYVIPIDRILLPFVGSPFVALTYSTGNAGLGTIPTLIQNLGVGVGVSVLRVDYTIDPASNRSPLSRRSAVTFGVSLSL